MRKWLGAVILAATASVVAGPGAAVERTFYTVAPRDPTGNFLINILLILNPLTGEIIDAVTITAAGETILGCNGLARDPTTGKLFAILNVDPPGRRLATIDTATGAATIIGSLNRNFAGLAFKSDGTLLGVTGDGDGNATNPETVFTINKTTGVSSLLLALGNGNDGEAIAFNPADGKLYHASGNDSGGIDPKLEVFESVNLDTSSVTNIPLSGAYTPLTNDYLEVTSLTYAGGGNLLLADGDAFLSGAGPRLYRITTGGVLTLVAPMDFPAKGMAFVPKPVADFDRDAKNDIGIYRDGVWSILRSTDGGTTVVGLGSPSHIPVHADYDGDGKIDQAVYFDGVWSILNSTDGSNPIVGHGGPGFTPVPADYDGDGKADIAVYKDGVWSIIRSSDGGNTIFGWGGSAFTPLPADYDGDGKADIAVYNGGVWSIVRSTDGGNTIVGHGGPAFTPVPADYDGDGKADIAVYHPTGVWSIRRSSDNGNPIVGHGGPNFIPVAADYDGDGKADIAVYLSGVWSIIRSSDNVNTIVGHGGQPQDVPLN